MGVFSLPVFSEFVVNEFVEGDHPQGLVDGDPDVLVGAFDDLLENLTPGFGGEQMLSTVRLHLN